MTTSWESNPVENPPDLPADLNLLATAFSHYDSPYEIYRYTYKYTACGPSIGFFVKKEVHTPTTNDPMKSGLEGGWIYCDDLRKLGASWEEVEANGYEIEAIDVSSIVEGSDAEVPGEQLLLSDFKTPADLDEAFYKLVEDVNDEACRLWDEANSEEEEKPE